MATYTDPSTINTNPNDPVTSEFGTAALDNPVAIAEGASGAPKIDAPAMNILLADVSVGRNASDSADATGLSRVDKVILHGNISGSNATAVEESFVEYQLSSDNGSTFGAAVELCRSNETSAFLVIDISAHDAIRVSITGGDVAQAFARAYVLGVTGTSP